MSFDVMEDCIHLKACRRVQAIGKKHRLLVPRYCTEDCNAYVSGERIKRDVQDDMCGAFLMGKDGYDEFATDASKLIDILRNGYES